MLADENIPYSDHNLKKVSAEIDKFEADMGATDILTPLSEVLG